MPSAKAVRQFPAAGTHRGQPDRFGKGRIIRKARDDVDVQMRGAGTEGGYVDLVGRELGAERFLHRDDRIERRGDGRSGTGPSARRHARSRSPGTIRRSRCREPAPPGAWRRPIRRSSLLPAQCAQPVALGTNSSPRLLCHNIIRTIFPVKHIILLTRAVGRRTLAEVRQVSRRRCRGPLGSARKGRSNGI